MRQLNKVIEEIGKVVKGKDTMITKVLLAILADGHVLMEDIPGVGKTTLALAFSNALDLPYHRVQFTPDVLPGDVTGFSMYNKKTGEFEYHQGSAFCSLLLADEINRTSPKTQSALLEVMEEKKVTVDGVTRALPDPFIVIATQNPFGSAGTQKLPESQMDRFMIRISMGYPGRADEMNILRGEGIRQMEQVSNVLSVEELIDIREAVRKVYVSDEILGYITDLVRGTRSSEKIALGISPRGSLALLKMARACAYYRKRDYVTPEDVLWVLPDVAGHRVIVGPRGRSEGLDSLDAVMEVADQLHMPGVHR